MNNLQNCYIWLELELCLVAREEECFATKVYFISCLGTSLSSCILVLFILLKQSLLYHFLVLF